MSERFEKLFELTPNLYSDKCPVIIAAGALYKDTKADNKVLAQLKLRNIGDRVVKSCKVSVNAYESNGNEVEGIKEFPYLDLNAGTGAEFGSRVPVYLPEKTTRSISAEINEIVFTDGTVFSSDSCEWGQIPEHKPLDTVFQDDELIKQFRIEAGEPADYYPEKNGCLIMCACGACNYENVKTCYACGKPFDLLFDCTDIDFLNERITKRKEQEKAEREELLSREQVMYEEAAALLEKGDIDSVKKAKDSFASITLIPEARDREEESTALYNELARKRKKSLIRKGVIGAVIMAVLAVLILVVIPFVRNTINYNKAAELVEEEKLDEAIDIYSQLGDFKDSEQKKTDTENKRTYKEAEKAFADKDYDKAYELFTSLGKYEDAARKAEEARKKSNKLMYEEAEKLYKNGQYKSAIAKYKQLGSYKDSEEKVRKAEAALKKQEEIAALHNNWNVVVFPSRISGVFTFEFTWPEGGERPSSVYFEDASGRHALSVRSITMNRAVLWDSRGVTHTLIKNAGGDYTWNWESSTGMSFS